MKNNGDEQSILGCSSRDTASENTLSLAQPHLNRQRYGHRWGIRRPSRFSRLVGQIKKLPVRANSQMSNSQTGYSPLRPATHPSTRHERRWNGWRCTERERERGKLNLTDSWLRFSYICVHRYHFHSTSPPTHPNNFLKHERSKN